MLSAPQYPVFPAGCSQRDTPDNDGRKDQSLQNGCGLFAFKFFQTQQKGHEQAEEPLFTYVIMRLMPSSYLVQMSMLCGDLG
ncbi:hypothetical protein TNCV_2378721 [Trichonephila clavipes]|uniref:Uncharacterized protein n=1 Tax=Trichonephila clavipes TaxID=2585209 RepID=A0A8X6V6D2_TRICX|nr:hypothetical protein TNCV_2378721 [Trichonephila clavipes]